jgi:hypothetical protein
MYWWVGPGQDEPLSSARVPGQYFVADAQRMAWLTLDLI